MHKFTHRMGQFWNASLKGGLIGGILLMCSLLCPAAEPLSVALVGDGYGKYEVEAIAKYVLDDMGHGYTYQIIPQKLDPKEFGKYGAVILARTTELYTPSETAQIEEYINNGGKLILISVAPRSLAIADLESGDDRARMRSSSFLFGTTKFEEGGRTTEVLAKESPILKGVFDDSQTPFWLEASIFLPRSDWENIIGNDADILVGRGRVGKGEVFYLGSELFRVMKTGKDKKLPDDYLSWVRILKNILQECATPSNG